MQQKNSPGFTDSTKQYMYFYCTTDCEHHKTSTVLIKII